MKYVMLLLTFLVSGIAAGHENDARQLLIETDQAWSQAASEGRDVEKVVAFWTEFKPAPLRGAGQSMRWGQPGPTGSRGET